ncbi:MAG: hypothetical protein EXQ91_06335 [Alphaproteobacteria bacterium]|nr:hypothetical protein [Alphaproteobacteria bacterium]
MTAKWISIMRARDFLIALAVLASAATQAAAQTMQANSGRQISERSWIGCHTASGPAGSDEAPPSPVGPTARTISEADLSNRIRR